MIGTCCSAARYVLLAALLALAPAAHAQDPDPEEAPRIEIDLAGVDLTTPEGMQAARRRINGAAWAVCRQVSDPDGLQMERMACVDRARREGVRQLAQLQQRELARRPDAGKAGEHALTSR